VAASNGTEVSEGKVQWLFSLMLLVEMNLACLMFWWRGSLGSVMKPTWEVSCFCSVGYLLLFHFLMLFLNPSFLTYFLSSCGVFLLGAFHWELCCSLEHIFLSCRGCEVFSLKLGRDLFDSCCSLCIVFGM